MNPLFLLIWLIPALAVGINILQGHWKGIIFSVWFTPKTYKKNEPGFIRVLLLNYLLLIIFLWSALSMSGGRI